ncbi:MAG: hypothetical protein A2172_02675 [Candidatus Woykebacteria bacterium RBG_13_40_15]|uniref:Helix-hairpin-helix DNA-binding motif class 1 domain-containing protein n=1 Tax=Candidatus Woykebacteria bacterium RBG_13_40_15 TaxID=1802593 RepID=A0A1G1W6B5_9BACT|nr:MAG: hypothetical protein A2172_02675 [Candidatus Woykebacteria bacterium RBG_13_40_15]
MAAQKEGVERAFSLVKEYQVSLILALAGLAFIGVGLSAGKLFSNNSEPQFIAGEKSQTQATNNVQAEISDKININTATEKELDSLPGIGPVRAEKIIENRPYESIEDLLNKKVLGEATFENIKDKIATE